jgi:hypothetical protein
MEGAESEKRRNEIYEAVTRLSSLMGEEYKVMGITHEGAMMVWPFED